MSKYEIILTKNSFTTEDFYKIRKSHVPVRPEVKDWIRRIQMSSRNPIGRSRSVVGVDFCTNAMTVSIRLYDFKALNTDPVNDYRSCFMNCDN